ncbi:MAG: DEAD/DEAH box helicase [Termitinemataceae bacterium]|nr:MAG: DEAD/DEAH box helicase [Termitinemataceae bacterium]
MSGSAAKPLIVQSGRTILLDVHADGADDARAAIMLFAELEKSPEHIHTYRITPVSLWNAASSGLKPADVKKALTNYSRYDLPAGIMENIVDTMARYGNIKLVKEDSDLILKCAKPEIAAELDAAKPLKKLITPKNGNFVLKMEDRGTVKWELIKLGWPVEDIAPLKEGEYLDFSLRCADAFAKSEGSEVNESVKKYKNEKKTENTQDMALTAGGKPFYLRPYQSAAVRSVVGKENDVQGYGVVVLPCGAGKTLVGMAIMAALKTNTLILTTNTAAVHQWIDELLDKSNISRENVAEYTGHSKKSAPITIATYQIITWRPSKNAEFIHFKLFRERKWGLIIYDEVHLLPAPVFRITAELQAVRRVGLTATLVREDGAESSVFCLVGPKRFDVPWKDLENLGWIAEAFCTEIRVSLPEDLKITYASAEKREKFRIAAENPAKTDIVQQLVENHGDDCILVIGQYIEQLEEIAKNLKCPLITGKTPNAKREKIYGAFKSGEIKLIVVSKVANFAIDLPDASVAIQVSGAFGSRQEEAQRLGRILRPKNRRSNFYSIVTSGTAEEEFALNRQQFLTEQGYKYSIRYWHE